MFCSFSLFISILLIREYWETSRISMDFSENLLELVMIHFIQNCVESGILRRGVISESLNNFSAESGYR